MLIRSSAIVLHTQRYNDTSFIAVLFTAAEGSVSFMVRIPKSRRAAIQAKLFRPFALLEVEWDERGMRNLQRLRSCTLSRPYFSIPYNPFKTTVTLFLAEFLYSALREEKTGGTLFDFIRDSFLWLDLCKQHFANFHLALLIRLTRYLGFFPNAENFAQGRPFDLLNSRFTSVEPDHPYYVTPKEAAFIPNLLRMNYETMHLFRFSRAERNRLLDVICTYYRLHVPGFPQLKSPDVLREVFDD